MRKVFVLISVLCLGQIACAQNTIGIPNIINYYKQDYKAGRQNGDIAQDRRGIMYFANDNGLLSYDGTFWRIYPLPNATIVRSLAIDKDDRIYVGGQQEFGYFYPGANGELTYTSLRNLLQSGDYDFTDVWNVEIVQQHIFFYSHKKIFEYTGHAIKVYNSINWGFLGYAAGKLLAYDFKNGLVYFKNGQWLPYIKTGSLPANVEIKSITHLGNDSLLLTSVTHGLFILKNDTVVRFESKDIKEIAVKNIAGACLLSPDRIALNTSLGGCVIINKEGKFIQRLTIKEGVQTNNVLCFYVDKDQNLWVGLDNGIDCITWNNAIKNIFPEPVDRNSGYTSIVRNNRLYLGTASGLYKANLPATYTDLSYTIGSFTLVENSKGQVWNVSEVNGQLLLAHNNGAFWVNDAKAVPVNEGTGFWNFLPLYDSVPSSEIMAGTYNGISFFHFKNNRIIYSNVYVPFESARFVIKNNNTIWALHPYRGLYMVSFNEQKMPVATSYIDRKKILSKNHNYLYRIAGRVVLATDNGFFELDAAGNDFVPSDYFNKLFGSLRVDYLKEDQAGNIWFCSNKRVGVVDRSEGHHRLIYIPEIDGKIMPDGFEHINIIDSNNVLIAAEKGFFHINYARYKKSKYPVTSLIRMVQRSGKNENLLYGGYVEPGKKWPEPNVNYSFNSLYFQCSAVLYGQQENISYSYFLKGFDEDWSVWTHKAEREFTNLPPGHYIFQVRSRNNFDNESPVASFSFTILPPWYRTWWAYTLYFCVFATLMYWFYKWQHRQFLRREQQKLLQQQQQYDEKQKQLKILHELEMGKSEQEIIRLTNEKLHADIEHKNSQLASTAMNLVRQMSVFSKIKDDLNEFKNNEAFKTSSKEFEKIIRLIDNELDITQEWEQFTEHFDQVHANFLKKLKEHCPALTTTELKLAAYLRLNLTTKEIAHLMNISIRGVETGRYRLRKKLGITSNDINLYDFLISVTS
ncbi:MAG TPA: triple tyrosine motif-containing protein [Niastella sp.]